MSRSNQPVISVPEELFHAIAVLMNRVIYIAEEECRVRPIDLLVLWHIRHFGKVHTDDQTVMLRQELTRVLTQKFRFTDPGVSKLLADLQEHGFIVRAAVTGKERLELFGSTGDTRVVILKTAGKQKIEDFKSQIRERAIRWLQRQPRATRLLVNTSRPVLEGFARWLVQRYEPDREFVVYPAEKRK
jgi:hypothetical protein